MKDKYLTVTALTKYVKRKMDSDPHLRDIWLRGEISNFKHHSRGHMYLTIKDDSARVQAVMFASSNRKLLFQPENGMNVLIRGEISVFEAYGQYQLYIHEMEPDGIGSLYQAFEQLKASLHKQGYFAEEYKKSIPRYPKSIAVITSPTGAAIKDILITMKRRYPSVKITVFPVLVQGNQAPASIVRAIHQADDLSYDVIIVGRGGGSIEELWSFNEEEVAKAIFKSKTPIISAVGHETDTTISDFVADLRAPTPTAAGELAVPSQIELMDKIEIQKRQLAQQLKQYINQNKTRLRQLSQTYAFKYPHQLVKQKEQQLDSTMDNLQRIMKTKVSDDKLTHDHLKKRLSSQHPQRELKLALDKLRQLHSLQNKTMNNYLEQHSQRLYSQIDKLSLVNPLEIMKRGYALPYDENGELIKSVKNVNINDTIQLKVADGEVVGKVSEIKEATENGNEGFNV
ncbi:exodeoxyribonuclease VII large subunit [Oceanobacillus kimchii]|uniref:exodeoxyribonuclease VII large subunit n=1 Tax=Oceanobacillus kimchii TaxID=746691 RepID=UPI00232C3472|nr:exodeoxyribonuclease VII large subunit [Oceanobacillus kimchii]